MIDLNDIGFHFGGRYLYHSVDWHIKPGERIGLVGLNGTGKSTLLRILTGEYSPSEGTLNIQKGTTIGFLNQDLLSYESGESIRNVALLAFERELQLDREIHEIADRLETDTSEKLIQLLVDKQHELEALDGYTIIPRTEEILEGLGFTTSDLDRPLKEFSGGWRMRVMLAKLLLQKPNLLMLDEPTNHLDLPSIEWLEEYLQDYEGTVIVVSHDRHFLDRMTNRTVEIANERLTVYPGNYSFYLEERELRRDLQQKSFENQQAYIKQQERFIERFKAKASKASSAQSRMKLLDKLERIDAVEDAAAKINLKFPMGRQSGKVVSRLEDVTKQFGDIHVLEKADFEIERGKKIALIGANGKGKSTLLRIIAGAEKIQGGKVEPGHGVITSFYAQHQLESLNVNNTLLQELQDFAPTKTEQELRTVLGCFLFTGDDVFKKIKVLSGGEKARVALAKMLLAEANFLLLDEPTNHLDMQSIGILINALKQYEGTFVVVSHDRYFVSEIANTICWIEDQQVREYPGTFEEYNWWVHKKQEEQKAIKEKDREREKKSGRDKEKTVEKTVHEPKKEDRNVSNNQVKKLRSTFEELEISIEKKKKQIAMKEAEFNGTNADTAALSKEYEKLNDELQAMQKDYEQIFEQLLSLESE